MCKDINLDAISSAANESEKDEALTLPHVLIMEVKTATYKADDMNPADEYQYELSINTKSGLEMVTINSLDDLRMIAKALNDFVANHVTPTEQQQ